MNEFSERFNLRRASDAYKRHGLSKEYMLHPIKLGPEPYNTELLDAAFYITTTTLPALTRESIDVPYQGVNLKTPSSLNYGNTTQIGFKTAADLLGWNTAMNWMNSMGNPLDGSSTFCVGNDSTIQYALVDDNNRITYAVEFVGVFPTGVSEISYNQESAGVTSFTVDFSFDYWCPISLEGIDLDQSPVDFSFSDV